MQQSKIQCHSHHTPLRFLAQPIIDTNICYVWVFDHFPNTKKEEKGFVQSYLLLLFISLSLFFAIRNKFLYVFFSHCLGNELMFTVRGSFEETQRVSVSCDSCSPLPDPTFFHYATYKQPSLEVALTKKRSLSTFVRGPRT